MSLPRMTGLGPMSPKYLRQTAQPNHLLTLQDAYASLGRNPENHISWTKESAVEVGRLYVKTWGELPQVRRLRQRYCLPEASTILQIFGSFLAYWQAIEEDMLRARR